MIFWRGVVGNNPIGFTAAESFLRPMIAKCNVLFSRWLLSGCGVDRRKYLSQRHSVASAVGSSKNNGCRRRQSPSKMH